MVSKGLIAYRLKFQGLIIEGMSAEVADRIEINAPHLNFMDKNSFGSASSWPDSIAPLNSVSFGVHVRLLDSRTAINFGPLQALATPVLNSIVEGGAKDVSKCGHSSLEVGLIKTSQHH